jgi:hypothetical protein
MVRSLDLLAELGKRRGEPDLDVRRLELEHTACVLPAAAIPARAPVGGEQEESDGNPVVAVGSCAAGEVLPDGDDAAVEVGLFRTAAAARRGLPRTRRQRRQGKDRLLGFVVQPILDPGAAAGESAQGAGPAHPSGWPSGLPCLGEYRRVCGAVDRAPTTPV